VNSMLARRLHADRRRQYSIRSARMAAGAGARGDGWPNLQSEAWQGLPKLGTALQPAEVVKDVFRRTGTRQQPRPYRELAERRSY
jgi:hypothetical protein